MWQKNLGKTLDQQSRYRYTTLLHGVAERNATPGVGEGVRGLSPVTDSYSGGLGLGTWSSSGRLPLRLHYNILPTSVFGVLVNSLVREICLFLS